MKTSIDLQIRRANTLLSSFLISLSQTYHSFLVDAEKLRWSGRTLARWLTEGLAPEGSSFCCDSGLLRFWCSPKIQSQSCVLLFDCKSCQRGENGKRISLTR